MAQSYYTYFKDHDEALAAAEKLMNDGYRAKVSMVDDNPEVPFAFGGRTYFFAGLRFGFLFGIIFGWLIGSTTTATSLTWPVMSAGLPAIITLFAFIFGSAGGFTGWLIARPWSLKYVVESTAEPKYVRDK